ncbi:hypothetical protein SAMN05421835_12363 [Amycolatopsis sacchari]|uniref:Uncharacterized protein n=1 Tax=Amycolatopsis sacchari TaxID=115433 RepID=A0A1I4A800_9PSEU|nr:hypothetical protein [Amycolatopsis sacchari]SFK52542.1 hypothetical protein SAMN05421835_12363 [Amycolatopsis sacchari]
MTRNPETVYTGLSPLQADGLACVTCNRNYLHSRVAHVPVGRSHTGSQVFACLGACLTALLDGAACECNGGPSCACPDCDCLDCSYRPALRRADHGEDDQ